jgi:cyclopropane fatty-acyl-phospholipid synthase-like methyltransferase
MLHLCCRMLRAPRGLASGWARRSCAEEGRLFRHLTTATHYDQARSSYDEAPFYSSAHPNYSATVDLVLWHLAMRPEHRLADIGAGNGAFTNALLQRAGHPVRATVVEPSEQFMSGVSEQPCIERAVNSSLVGWAALRADGGSGRFDRLLLKEMIHHLGDRAEREASLALLRENRLSERGRLVLLTRHHDQHGIPLFAAARQVWTDNQPTAAALVADLEAAGFVDVKVTESTLYLPCTFPVPSLYLPCTFPVPSSTSR